MINLRDSQKDFEEDQSKDVKIIIRILGKLNFTALELQNTAVRRNAHSNNMSMAMSYCLLWLL